MTKLKNAFIAIMAMIALAFVSCENDKLDTIVEGTSTFVVENTQVSELNTVQEDSSMFARRSGNDCNSNFVEEYIPLTGINILQTSSAVQVNANTFYFNTRVLGTFKGIYLKTYSPIGQVCYQKMEKSGSTYSISQSFYRSGTYYYKYFINTYGNKLVPISNSLSFDLELVIPSASDYRYPYRDTYVSGRDICVADKWRFCARNCTSWVAYQINRMWGTETAFHNTNMFYSNLGAAKNWKRVLTENGYTYSSSPQPGDIAWWDSKHNGADELGHVAFVQSIDSDGTVHVSEYNWGKELGFTSDRPLRSLRSKPSGYIHVQFKK